MHEKPMHGRRREAQARASLGAEGTHRHWKDVPGARRKETDMAEAYPNAILRPARGVAGSD